jgi:HPt (histidine-containing phosphotransfer) domain-containing protein
MDIYIFALESFVSHTPNSVEKLRSVTEENLPDYAIAAHGLKGVCAAIGAENMREKARKLEAAAKAGDLQTVLAGNDELLRGAEKLVGDVKDWLKNKQA